MTALSYQRISLAILAVLSSVLFFAHATGLRNALAGSATLAVMAFLARERGFPKPFLPALPWLALCLLSALWSVAPGHSLGDALTSALLPLGSGLAAYRWLNRDNVLRWLIYPVLIGLATMVAVRLAFISFAAAPAWLATLYYYWPERGVMSTLAILTLPMGAWLMATGRRALGAIALVLAMVAGSQNWNRMFWLASVVTLVSCLFMARLERRTLAALVIAGTLMGGIGVWYAQKQLANGRGTVEAVQTDARWKIWLAWIEVAAKRPLAGYGYGMRASNQVGVDERLPEELALGRGHPHNVLLGQLVQLGGLGLLLFVIVQGSLVRHFAGHRDGAESRAAAMAGIALVAGFLAKNMTDDFSYHSVAVMYWIQLGAFLRLARAADD